MLLAIRLHIGYRRERERALEKNKALCEVEKDGAQKKFRKRRKIFSFKIVGTPEKQPCEEVG